jgi:hypothetical protein
VAVAAAVWPERLATGGDFRMELPAKFVIHNFAYAFDGGTTVIQATDEAGQQHAVMLVQHAFPQPSASLEAVPGRLYFNGELVSMRSQLEAGLLVLLRSAEVHYSGCGPKQSKGIQISSNALILGEGISQVLTCGPEESIRELLAKMVQFVESDAYLQFAQRVEQAADSTLYTLWAALEPGNHNPVVVRLGRVLGIGLQAAREMVDRGIPLASGVSALEVADIAQRYAAESVRLRIEPAYAWPLP